MATNGRSDLSHGLQALVEGDAGVVRGRRRNRDNPQLRARSPVAQLHGHLRRGVRARVHPRGLLLLPRGHLHRRLCLRLGPPIAAHALLERHPGRRGWLHRLADGPHCQRLDEQPRRLHARERARQRRTAAGGALRQRVPLARARPHVPGRLHGRRFRHCLRLCLGLAKGPPGSIRAGRARRAAVRCRARGTGTDRRRRLGGPLGRARAADKARRLRGPLRDGGGRARPSRRLVQRRRDPLRRATASSALAARLPRSGRPRPGARGGSC
jgi:hypothetical protein